MRKTRRKDPEARCKLCDIKLESKFGAQRRRGGQRRSYCDSCGEQKKLLNRIYTRNYYRRKHGLKPDPINEKTIERLHKRRS